MDCISSCTVEVCFYTLCVCCSLCCSVHVSRIGHTKSVAFYLFIVNINTVGLLLLLVECLEGYTAHKNSTRISFYGTSNLDKPITINLANGHLNKCVHMHVSVSYCLWFCDILSLTADVIY